MMLDSTKLMKFERLKELKEIGCFELSNGEEVSGRVVALHSDYLVLEVARDFHFDGYAYIEYKNIEEVLESESNRFYSNLFNDFCSAESEGVNLPDTYKEVISDTAASQRLVIFELEEELHLGKVLKLENSIVYLEPLSSTGEFMGEFEIGLSEILFIRDKSEYINAYAFYVENNTSQY